MDVDSEYDDYENSPSPSPAKVRLHLNAAEVCKRHFKSAQVKQKAAAKQPQPLSQSYAPNMHAGKALEVCCMHGRRIPCALAWLTTWTRTQTSQEIYQKKSQLEHILLRPDTYIGSTEKQQQQMWVHDGTDRVVVLFFVICLLILLPNTSSCCIPLHY